MSYTINRSFVLENQLTQQNQILKGEITISNDFVNLKPILDKLGNINHYRFRIYDFIDNKYHPLKQYTIECQDTNNQFLIPLQLVRTQIVLMKFVLDDTQTVSMKSGSQSASQTSTAKKERSKQRTIAEVIQIVKQWRELHVNSNNGKKVNLQESAQMLGISKKSLDDYYYQLRLGQKYDFDFSTHLNEKVGVLRTFIKDIKSSKKDSRAKIQKHPKKLKIIEQMGQFQLQPKTKSKSKKSNKSQSQDSQQNQINQFQQTINIKMHAQAYSQDQSRKQINSIENQFYNQFEFMGEEPLDPFLNFQCDFKKKNYDDQSDQLFF